MYIYIALILDHLSKETCLLMTRRSPIIRGLNITDVVSGRTLQHAAAPLLRKQAAWYMGRITRSCTSGQNGATGISIMAFRLRFPGTARLSSSLQGNAYQSGRVSIKALNPVILSNIDIIIFGNPKPLITKRDEKTMMSFGGE